MLTPQLLDLHNEAVSRLAAEKARVLKEQSAHIEEFYTDVTTRSNRLINALETGNRDDALNALEADCMRSCEAFFPMYLATLSALGKSAFEEKEPKPTAPSRVAKAPEIEITLPVLNLPAFEVPELLPVPEVAGLILAEIPHTIAGKLDLAEKLVAPAEEVTKVMRRVDDKPTITHPEPHRGKHTKTHR